MSTSTVWVVSAIHDDGEEFVLHAYRSQKSAEKKAAKLRKRVEDRIEVGPMSESAAREFVSRISK